MFGTIEPKTRLSFMIPFFFNSFFLLFLKARLKNLKILFLGFFAGFASSPVNIDWRLDSKEEETCSFVDITITVEHSHEHCLDKHNYLSFLDNSCSSQTINTNKIADLSWCSVDKRFSSLNKCWKFIVINWF